MAWAQYRRTRRLQPAQYGLDPLPVEGPIEFTPARKGRERIGPALRAWSAGREHADSVAPERIAESAPAPIPEPEPRTAWQATAPAPRIEAAKQNAYTTYHTERVPDPEPASHAAPKQASAPCEPPPAREENCAVPPETPLSQSADYYEVLQISPNADPETVHRVYRIMASRFHPDNPVTGSLDRFLQLREAYQTLSEPALRAAYDASHQSRQTEPLPIFWQKSFVDGIEGESNRRLGVLSLLYHRRRVNEDHPGVSVMELEQRMAFPREYLNFALWYLRSKGYVALMQDNSDYAVTSAGVDFVESCSVKNNVIRELLTAGNGAEEPQSQEHPDNVRRMSPRLPRETRPEADLDVRPESNCGD